MPPKFSKINGGDGGLTGVVYCRGTVDTHPAALFGLASLQRLPARREGLADTSGVTSSHTPKIYHPLGFTSRVFVRLRHVSG